MSRPARLAVTGHRLNRIPAPERARLRAEIARTLRLFEAAAGDAGFASPPILASALAEGADRYAADAALGKGWRLEAPLPFKKRRYLEDFPEPASQDEFLSLLARAATVREIDGAKLIARGADGAAPYAAVGEALLEGADAVLAVWNGAPKNGPGGTAEVLEDALLSGRPVLWIPPEVSRGAALLRPPGKADALTKALAAAFAPIAAPAALDRLQV